MSSIPNNQPAPHELANQQGLRIQLHRDGSIAAIRHGETLINRLITNPGDQTLTRLYLRLFDGEKALTVNLLDGDFSPAKEHASWSGEQHGVAYRCTLSLASAQTAWFWTITLNNHNPRPIDSDLIYGQDIGIADLGAARNNESYISHYIDHSIFQHPNHQTVVCSRQNQEQNGGRFPWLLQGCSPLASAYSTDATQFFGNSSRLGAQPAALTANSLPSRRLQQEFAYTGLQTRRQTLDPNSETIVTFFAIYLPDHPAASSSADLSLIDQLKFPSKPNEKQISKPVALRDKSLFQTAPIFNGEQPNKEQLAAWFPGNWNHLEQDANGEVLSFFHQKDRHVITRAKELLNERPHGHILRSGDAWWPEQRQVGGTAYASGIFGAQIYAANVNLSRLLGVARCTNNILRSYGQRIFIETAQGWQQLGVPSAFEMSPHHARWHYANGEISLEITAWCPVESDVYCLQLKVANGEARRFLISNQLVAGANELEHPLQLVISDHSATVTPAAESLAGTHYPGLSFEFLLPQTANHEVIGDGALLGGNAADAPYLVFQTKAVREFQLVAGAVWPGDDTTKRRAAWKQAANSELNSKKVDWCGGFAISAANPTDSVLSQSLPWLSHNAMIHFSAPHGLEQFGGAAWGLRDVCQGPAEWLLAQRRYPTVRRILENVFSQQYLVDPLWPQWYMHQPFAFIQHCHSHGDIPFWPVKALADYIETSNDFSILDAELPYTDHQSFKTLTTKETVLRHVGRVIDHYERRCIGDTAIINYGDGDWDDTLQPANSELRSRMTSPWTVTLSYHAFRQFAEICRRAGISRLQQRLEGILERMQSDFRKHLMPDGIICGFAQWNGSAFEPLFHPRDKETGIAYRLLPMNRAILSELLTPSEAALHLELIREHLLYPDGVRLMSSPVPYQGGLMKRFRRAESAAYFGREVSLQYVHEHIRYCEVMAKMGDAPALIDNLLKVLPIGLEKRLPNAAPRQSNAYFSSSDGDFADRLEAASRFADLRSGKVQVKGGWRIYSSGPGLLFHNIVCKLFGLRESFGNVVFDPVLTDHFTHSTLSLSWNEKPVTLHFKANAANRGDIRINGKTVAAASPVSGKYRREGTAIPRQTFENMLSNQTNEIEIVI